MNKYIGHESQLYGVEEHKLVGGRGDGLTLFEVRNGAGLEITFSKDRAMDIPRLSLGGVNLGFFSPAGYVAPTYYDDRGFGFLKSFTAGFLTTCGFCNVGIPCEDGGEVLPQHGTLSNIPAEYVNHYIENGEIHIKTQIRDAAIFARKILMEREYIIPLFKNELTLKDTVTNIGSSDYPLQMLYHFNMGYPLVSESAVLEISADNVRPATAVAEAGIKDCKKMESPQANYEEQCFVYDIKGEAEIKLYNPAIKKGVVMRYDTKSLPYFTEWKMMGEYDYVLGLEPANALTIGRAASRERGILEFLAPDQSKTHIIKFEFIEK